ncbi:DUF2798 domain-containing protein [Phreatobacter oligotrophus]|uniref:Uncharacterized protein DUF2798 n=1 Tax=Phreatobacter oligotrophus TaxID=1122261 RepID=A0A2T4ZI29_9HYPH|nr:DUF2798 domain-containing protein [Phreatobacter oligotrophus]PTM61623.1 uncharacterized protein DUF2798 [Phreatobacter oligotrophus]
MAGRQLAGQSPPSGEAHAEDPAPHIHFVFGALQSGLTSGVATAVASWPALQEGLFLAQWLRAWLIAWALMLPIVIVAAPAIRAFAMAVTSDGAGD